MQKLNEELQQIIWSLNQLKTKLGDVIEHSGALSEGVLDHLDEAMEAMDDAIDAMQEAQDEL